MATVGRLLGVGAVVVVVDVPTPIRRPLDEVGLPAAVAGTVVVVVTGRVRVDVVTGRGRSGLAGGTVVVGGAVVVVVAGSVPTPATGRTLNKFKASSTLMG